MGSGTSKVLAALGSVRGPSSRCARFGGIGLESCPLAIPFFSLRLGFVYQGNDAAGTTTRQAYDMLAAGFGPGFNGPLLLVSVNHGGADPTALDRLVSAFKLSPMWPKSLHPRCLRPKTAPRWR